MVKTSGWRGLGQNHVHWDGKLTADELGLSPDNDPIVEVTSPITLTDPNVIGFDFSTNNTWTGTQVFGSDITIPDESYSSAWNGVAEPTTKNAVYDKIESLPQAPVTVMRTTDQSVTTDTMTNDDTLSFSLAANAKYIFEFRLLVTEAATTAFVLDLNGASSPTQIVYHADRNGTSLGGTSTAYATEYAQVGAGSSNLYIIRGFLRNGSNTGTLNIRYRLLAAVTTYTVQDGSCLIVHTVT